MNRYIRADLHRIFRRISRYIVLVLGFILLGLIIRSTAKTEGTTVYQIVDLLVKAVPYVAVAFGLVEYLYVYVDDFRAKTIQIAIGTGIRRRHVILAKWIEHGFVCIVDYAVLIAMIFGICGFYGISFSGAPAKDVHILFLFGWLKTFVCIGITMIVVFRTQATTGGLLLYLALCVGLVKGLASIIFEIKAIKPLHLSDYLFSSIIDVAKSRAIVGTVSIPHIAGIAAYIIVCYLAACLLFRKREMEF